jgi:beta-phosphoglucomutase-like phosphatase (HAD superfamily)
VQIVSDPFDDAHGGRETPLGPPASISVALFDLACAQAFSVDRPDAAVFEDELSGIEAGRAGGFGYVVGVDRVGGGQHAAAMREAGADEVVAGLAELLSA